MPAVLSIPVKECHFLAEVMTRGILPKLKDFSDINTEEAKSVLLFFFVFNAEVILVYIYVVDMGILE